MSAAAAAPLLISLQGAAVRFGPVQALFPLNLQLAQGERLLLVGANGSGKTTLLRALHGLVPCEGRRVLHARPGEAAPTLAMVFQKPFMLSLSVQANVHLGLWLRGVPRAERQRLCALALQRVGLQGVAARPAHALSGGQQQRLAIARAWALRPQVLLLDEPTAHLDPSAKREVETLVAEIAAEGTTVVMSTHNLGQAKRLATRVAYMEAGRVVVDLPVLRFFSETLPPEATQFLRGELLWQGAETGASPR